MYQRNALTQLLLYLLCEGQLGVKLIREKIMRLLSRFPTNSCGLTVNPLTVGKHQKHLLLYNK